MSTPSVTEITRRPEPVAHDTFIDDLCVARGAAIVGSALAAAADRRRLPAGPR
jgi:hypothetical protein